MSNRKISSKKKSRWIVWTIILALFLCIIVIASIFVVRYSISKGITTASNAFLGAFEDAKDDTYSQFHDAAYELAEKGHHVSNDVTISISSIKERSSLEVLSVSDVVYIFTDAETKSGTTSWLKVTGTGKFTVNLTSAEYVVDSERRHVLVRVPRPELDSKNISIDNVETLLFKENKWNVIDNSVKSGHELAQNQVSEARQRIQMDFEENEQYAKFAESSTVSMLSALIKGFNPDVEDLVVNVEFYE